MWWVTASTYLKGCYFVYQGAVLCTRVLYVCLGFLGLNTRVVAQKGPLTVSVVDGPLITEVHQTWSDWATLVLRCVGQHIGLHACTSAW